RVAGITHFVGGVFSVRDDDRHFMSRRHVVLPTGVAFRCVVLSAEVKKHARNRTVHGRSSCTSARRCAGGDMSRTPRLAVAGVVAFLGVAVVHAQTAQTPPQTPRPSVPATNQTTITGCVERGDLSASAASSDSFVLVKEAPAASASTAPG